jgi:hypothetical protein
MKSSPKDSVTLRAFQACASLAKRIHSLLVEKSGTESGAVHCAICGIAGASVDSFPSRGYGKPRHGSLPSWPHRINQVEDQDPENIQFGPVVLKHAT